MFDELIGNLSNIQVFTESLHSWISNLSVNSAIIFVMMIFMLLGAIDKIRGKYGADTIMRAGLIANDFIYDKNDDEDFLPFKR